LSDEKERELRRKADAGDESAKKKLAAALERRGERFFATCQIAGPTPEGFEPAVVTRSSTGAARALARKISTLDEVFTKRDRPITVWDAAYKTAFLVGPGDDRVTSVRFGEQTGDDQSSTFPDRIELTPVESALVSMAQERHERAVARHREDIERGQRAMQSIHETNAVLQQSILGILATRGLAVPEACRIDIRRQPGGSIHLIRHDPNAPPPPEPEVVSASEEEAPTDLVENEEDPDDDESDKVD